MRKIYVFLAVLLSLLGGQAKAGVATVVSPGENTLYTAVASAASGDTLILVSGSYIVGSTNASGTLIYSDIPVSKTITIRAASGLTTKPEVTMLRMLFSTVANTSLILKGINFIGASGSLEFVDCNNNLALNSLIIKDCNVQNYLRGFRFTRNTCTIENVDIDGLIMTQGSGTYPCFGFDSKSTVRNFTIKNSTLYNIANSVFPFAIASGLFTGDSTRITIDHNTFYNCVTGTKYFLSTPASNTIVRFTNNVVNTLSDPANAYPFKFSGGLVKFSNNSITNFTSTYSKAVSGKNNPSDLSSSTYSTYVTLANNDFTTDPGFSNASGADFTITNQALFTLSANGDGIGDPRWLKVNSLNIVESGVNLGTTNLTAQIVPANAGDRALTWALRTEDADFATINTSTGVLTANSIGKVVATASLVNRPAFAVSSTISIFGLDNSIKIIGKSSVSVGAKVLLYSIVSPIAASQTVVTWSVDNTSKATINAQTGELTTIAAGTVIVTATDGGSLTATKTIRITRPATSLSISGGSSVVKTNKLTLTASVLPADADQTVTWTVKDAQIASINASTGELTGLTVGSVEVVATTNDGTGVVGSTVVSVQPLLVSSIQVNGAASVTKLQKSVYSATVLPSAADNKSIVWSVSNSNATIDASTGVLTAVSVGTVDVKATSADGSAVYNTKTVTIAPILVSTVEISGPQQILAGASSTYKAVVLPSNADNRTASWSLRAEDAAIASINATTGVLTTTSTGTIVISLSSTDASGVAVSQTIEIGTTVIPVSSVSLSGASSVVKTKSIRPSVAIMPANASDKSVSWSLRAEDASYASIDAVSGEIVGIAVGSVVVTATANDGSGLFATQTIVISPLKVTSITVSGATTVVKTNSISLSATATPDASDNKAVTWSIRSADADYATINASTGLLLGTKVGTAVAIATATDGSGVSASYTVSITALKVSAITISGATSTIIGQSVTLSTSVTPAAADNKVVSWSLRAADSDYASINASTGEVTGKKPGSVVVTATATDGSAITANYNLAITGIMVSGVSISGSSTIIKTQSTSLTATVSPSDATNKTIVWSLRAKDADYATINASTGVVTAKKVGQVVAIATANDGSGVYDMFIININPLKVSSVSISGSSTITKTNTVTMSATVLPALADEPTLVWSVNNTNATINASTGVLTANSAGSVIVTATSTDGSGVSGVYNVTINALKISSMSINSPYAVMKTKSQQMSVAISPADADNKEVSWSLRPEDAELATINATSGLLTTKSATGTVEVTASSKDGSGVVTSAYIYILPLQVSSMVVSGPSSVVRTNSATYTVTIGEAAADNQTYSWSLRAEDAPYATIDASTGVLSTSATGTVQVKASALDGSGVVGTYNVTISPLLVDNITVSGPTVLAKGEQIQLSAVATPAQADNKVILWTIRAGDTIKAAIDPLTGALTAKTAGSVTVLAKATDGSDVVGNYIVSVSPIKVSELTISASSSVVKTKSITLNYSALPADASNKLAVWSLRAEDAEYASINEYSGELTGLKVGSVVATATAIDGSGVTASIAISVEPLKVTALTIAGNSSVAKGQSLTLTAGIYPDAADNKNVSWSLRSEDAEFASINDASVGVISTFKVGTIVVTATSVDDPSVAASKTITIKSVPVSSIVISGETSVIKGQSITLSAAVSPSNAAIKIVSWSVKSSDASKASINPSTGELTAIAVGSVTVIATSTDGAKVVGTYVVTVTPLKVNSIVITGGNRVGVNRSIQLYAVVLPTDVDNDTVAWSVRTEDASKASVDKFGVVTGIVAGTIVVTATATDGSGIAAVDTITVFETTGVRDVQSQSAVSMYPVPVVDVLTISSSAIISKVSVYTLSGTEVLTMNSNEQLVSVSMQNLASGQYIVKVSKVGTSEIETKLVSKF